MIGMKVRYEIGKVSLKISNVTLPNAEDSYVLLTAADDNKNEVVFALTHEQAQYIENELYEANRRWKEHSSTPIKAADDTWSEEKEDEETAGEFSNQFSH
jgi:hypothetical protein